MNITKKPLLDAGNQGIIGFEITISSYFFNVNKANDQLNKIRDKRYDVEYIIDEWQESQSEIVEETDELQILKGTLQELITEEEKLTKEIDDYYNRHDETDQSNGEFNPYNHLYSDSRSLSYATTLDTDASFIKHKPDEFGDFPPYLSVNIESFKASIDFTFSSAIAEENRDDIVLRFFTDHTLYGEMKSYGVSISSYSTDSYSSFVKFCEWVRMDAEEDFVDDDLGYWGTDQTFSDGESLLSLDNCTISPGHTSLSLHSLSVINIKALSCTIDFHDEGKVSALIKIINGNELVEQRDTLGFMIANRDAILSELVNEIFTDKSPSEAIDLFRKLNGPDDSVIKAGSILILADPEYPYEEELAQLITAQKTAQLALEAVENEGINRDFFLDHYATLSHFSSIASTGVGITGTVGEVYFTKINKILNQIDQLYKSTYVGNTALGGEAYYLRRGVLFSELDTLLKHSFLRQVFDLPQDQKIKSALRLSSKSIVHHWKKSGTTEIPGYATHLNNASKLVKIMKTTGYVGIAFSAMYSANEIYNACSVGRVSECKQTTFREIGKFTGGIAGGALGAPICIALGITGPWNIVGCAVGLSIIGTGAGTYFGESVGDILYNIIEKKDEYP